ncbi:TonB family protein [Novosphingobium resinovorum]|uniref:energy transducer TonB family protein n=1 Tax=Novosphingobium resinovorum TaxID=158500 RepID=UPI002ED1B987|nr:TonB family protein [Novosphingobium resinovorum]
MLLNEVRSADGDRPGLQNEPIVIAATARAPIERHGYRPAASSRWFGLVCTALIACLVAAGFFVTISIGFVKPAPQAALTVVDLMPPASPREAPLEERQAPKPVEKKEPLPDRAPMKPVELRVVPILPVAVPVVARTSESSKSATREPETVAPKTVSAPPAPQISSKGAETWEGQVLAALNKQRRYPRLAVTRRQQGVPWVRFVMDREGKVLSARLERSSSFPDLDREAVALPKRAQPLPKPPADKAGNTLELVVPVEFFIR